MVREKVLRIWGDGKKRQLESQEHQGEENTEGEDLSKK